MTPPQAPLPHFASPGVPFPPPLIFIVVAGVGLALKRSRPWRIMPVDTFWLEASGWCVASLGTLLCLWAAGMFWRARTALMPVKPATAFVTHGPYRFSRNPMYVGMTIAQVGASMILDTWWLIVVLPVAVLLTQWLVILREERYLAARFGADYHAYCQRTRRWL